MKNYICKTCRHWSAYFMILMWIWHIIFHTLKITIILTEPYLSKVYYFYFFQELMSNEYQICASYWNLKPWMQCFKTENTLHNKHAILVALYYRYASCSMRSYTNHLKWMACGSSIQESKFVYNPYKVKLVYEWWGLQKIKKMVRMAGLCMTPITIKRVS